MSKPELSCEELRNLLFAFEGSDEPEVIKTVFSRLCEFFAWAAHRGIEALPCRDRAEAVPLHEFSAWFARIVAWRMGGQEGNTEDLRMTGQEETPEELWQRAYRIVSPDVAFGWANPPNRRPVPKWTRFERDYAIAACVELFERGDSASGKRSRAKKRVANLFNCSESLVSTALRNTARYSSFGRVSTEELEEIRSSIKPLPPRR